MFISKRLILTFKFTRFLSSSSVFDSTQLPIQSLLKIGLAPTQQSLNQHVSYLCLNRRFNSALHFFAQLTANNFNPPFETQSILATALLDCHDFEELANLLDAQMKKIPNLPQTRIWDSLIRVLCDRDSDKALCLLKEWLSGCETLPLFSTFRELILCFCAKGDLSRAAEVLELMTDEKFGYPFDNFVCSFVMESFCLVGKPQLAVEFFQKVAKNEARIVLPTAVVKNLSRNGGALNAYSLVTAVENKLPIKDVVDGSILVDALCKEGRIDVALDLCRFLKKHGISPNIVTYNSILHGLCRQGCYMEAFRLFDSFERLGLAPTVVTYSILIDALCKEGYFIKAEWLLGRMVLDGLMPNVRTFNSLIDGYCKFGYNEKALELHSDLQIKELKPDEFTVSAVINGFGLKGDVQGALDFYIEPKRKGESPDFLGFLYLIRGLLTKGRMEEARGILKEMLQTKSVRDSINQVDAEVETESIESFLVDLCDQGCIKEAVTILDEIGLILFPIGIASSHKQKFSTGSKGNVSDTASSRNIVGSDSQSQNFNNFYPAIVSFCSEGEIQNANSLVKQMLQRFSVVEDRSTESP
ncbi:hypothetical protein QQ045_000078 [Rhodiola kirilowii]